MANKRCIPTRFFQDPDIVDLRKDTQLILIGLVLHADDEGREVAHSKVLGQAMDYSPEQIEEALTELVAHELIVLYQVGRHRYYSLIQQWQSMGAKMTPSRHPAPPTTRLEDVPGISAGNPASSSNSAGTSEISSASLGNLAQLNSIESNSSEEEGKDLSEGTPHLPENVTPFPAPPSADSGDGVLLEERLTQTTRQVARILKLSSSEALSRLVAEYVALPGLSLLGEADAAREWIDDPRRNRQRQRMSPAFFRRWLKREQVALAAQSQRQAATGTDGSMLPHETSTHPAPPASPGLSGRSLMDLEAQYRASTTNQKGRQLHDAEANAHRASSQP